MAQIKPEKTVGDIVSEIGQDVIREATGREDRTIRRWKRRGKFPASQYETIKQLAKARRLTKPPISAFGFKE